MQQSKRQPGVLHPGRQEECHNDCTGHHREPSTGIPVPIRAKLNLRTRNTERRRRTEAAVWGQLESERGDEMLGIGEHEHVKISCAAQNLEFVGTSCASTRIGGHLLHALRRGCLYTEYAKRERGGVACVRRVPQLPPERPHGRSCASATANCLEHSRRQQEPLQRTA